MSEHVHSFSIWANGEGLHCIGCDFEMSEASLSVAWAELEAENARLRRHLLQWWVDFGEESACVCGYGNPTHYPPGIKVEHTDDCPLPSIVAEAAALEARDGG